MQRCGTRVRDSLSMHGLSARLKDVAVSGVEARPIPHNSTPDIDPATLFLTSDPKGQQSNYGAIMSRKVTSLFNHRL